MSGARNSLMPRLLTIAVWMAILAWLPFEDQSTVAPVVFGLLIGVLFSLRIVARSVNPGITLWAAAGLAAGLAAGPLAVGLMILKSGLHAHGIPDFSVDQITGVLQRTPVFALAGSLLGAGLRLVAGRLVSHAR